MDSLRTMLLQYMRAAWRRRWLGVVVAWLVCGVGWVGTYAVPNQFESSARLFVDADAILTPLLRGIAAAVIEPKAERAGAGRPQARRAAELDPSSGSQPSRTIDE